MSNFKRFICLTLFFLLTIPTIASAVEYIPNFHSEIVVNPDSSLTITENITVRHEGRRIRRGIVRGLSTAKGERYQIIGVTRNGSPEPWFAQKENGQFALSTGDNTLLPAPAVSTYTITYNMYDALRPIRGEDANELYLNITGKWDFPIENLSVTVHFPEGTQLFRQWQYQTGKPAAELTPNGEFSYSKLNTNEEATIAIAFSKGTVDIPLPQTLKYLTSAIVATLLYYLIIWYHFGKDPAARPIVPDWEPPAGFTPLECAFIDNNGTPPDNALFIHLLWLAHKKLITITENIAGKSYTINYTTNDNGYFSEKISKIKLNNLTLDGTPNERAAKCNDSLISLTERKLKRHYYATRRAFLILGALITPAISFFCSTTLFGLIWIFFPLIVFSTFRNKLTVFVVNLQMALPYVVDNTSGITRTDIACTVLYFALYYLFKYLLFQPTPEGQRIREQIEGLKMFLKTITANGVRPVITTFKNGLPQEKRLTPEDMEELFPYAVALGLEKDWSKKFATVFGNALYSQTIADLDYYHPRYRSYLSKSCTKSAVSPSSNGSGSSGGGFAGGGFGGGCSGGR